MNIINFDLRYDLINNCEIVNIHEIGKYSVNYNGEHSYSLIIGDGFRTIDFKFEMRKAEGTLHWNCGAATMREYYENEEMSKRVCDHLFLIIGVNEIDLFEECIILIVDSIDVPIRWDNVDFIVESKNYYCIRLNYGGVIPIHKNGFTQNVDLKMFEEFLFDKTKRKFKM